MSGSIITDYDGGNQRWFTSGGKPHRVDGPAFVHRDGNKAWFQYGIRHCENGPSIVLHNGIHRWFLFGKEFTKEEFWKRVYHD